MLGEVTEARLYSHGGGAGRARRIFPKARTSSSRRSRRQACVRILIWERGVGPTEASGTGACAAAVAAHRYGGAASDVRWCRRAGHSGSSGGDGLYLTGWAQMVAEATWLS